MSDLHLLPSTDSDALYLTARPQNEAGEEIEHTGDFFWTTSDPLLLELSPSKGGLCRVVPTTPGTLGFAQVTCQITTHNPDDDSERTLTVVYPVHLVAKQIRQLAITASRTSA